MRSLARWVAAAATTSLALAGVTGAALPAHAAGPDLLPLTIDNTSGLTEDVYLYVLGTDLQTGKLGWVDSAGTFHPWPAGSNPPAPAPDVAIKGASTGGHTTLTVPRGFSGRVYFSFGDKLPFALTQDGLVQPAPWAPGDPTENILFDWTEFTYNDAGLWINSSQVDMFALPHAVSVTGADGRTATTGQVKPGGRQAVIDALSGHPDWAGSVITRDDGTVLRVLAPGKAAGVGLMSPTYLDGYIASAWDAYATRDLTVTPFSDQPDVTFTGRTHGSTMRFTDSTGATVAQFDRPSSADVWGCDGALHAPNDRVVGPIARTLCAALTRGTLGTSTVEPVTDASAFYTGDPVNLYGKAVHDAMVDGRAYAFAFDDVGAFESLVHSGDPTGARISLTALTGSESSGSGDGDASGSDGSDDAGNSGGDTGGSSGGSTGDGSDDGSGDNTGKVALRSVFNDKCVTVPMVPGSAGAPGLAFNDGQRVHMWDCANGAGKVWEFTDGTVRTTNNMCLDVAWGSTANGAPVQIAHCSGNAAQQWVLSDAGDLVNPQANKCVDIVDRNQSNGAALQLWECSGEPHQKWVTN
ncbi:glycoside hydrolase family 64 protein [Jonesia denitrificans]|uniref:Glucan endo-1,3-beta-D-glucosidase n=1 Tax=Jonesia denitrificans (strain ATCC 14870 / DSM 20603 / BCRC 15368 / CIP 55.134 / JCM 11481 / NBRC 15587 / NCTC 10816 / Prevot 55134) TaxID=471856 RepID=C7QZ87_JONDD|nr:beta-1,3-glucanase family protein [Jonesia denitrificans]ACV07995.1 Glucan endo-1,3-beta-D-glucosidase [Jonesia denitrificans DSM 20603]ASE08312.1 glucan endo-1,3-beta-D-glucosidase [Jonesia denitrificans]QXB42914.1 ricin-type beta-trefoil lectin domain protein [Jonesia denitrificans]SQH19972.1 Glucan endo-1,3-beta-glucosidase precursor [Jonesia denitrificans]